MTNLFKTKLEQFATLALEKANKHFPEAVEGITVQDILNKARFSDFVIKDMKYDNMTEEKFNQLNDLFDFQDSIKNVVKDIVVDFQGEKLNSFLADISK